MTGMAKWSDYAYCKHCDRPLRKGNQHRYEEYQKTYPTGGAGPVYHCRLCGRRGDGFNPFEVVCIIMFTTMPFFGFYFKDWKPFFNPATILFFFIALLIAGLNQWRRFKLKAFYDRWVKQHGTDPDKWPDPDLY